MAKKVKAVKTFLSEEIWRVKDTEMNSKQRKGYYMLKVAVISARQYARDRIAMKAKALTYSTALSLVPILALLFAIARGFGFSNLLESLFRNGIAVGSDTLDTVMTFIDSYLEHTHSGIFIGIGFIVLLWSIITLTGNIEQNMNAIWGIQKQRTIFRKITDYFSMFLLLPLFIICIAGWSIFMTTVYSNLQGQFLLSTFVRFLIKAAPYVLSGLIFTGMFIFFPNTKVRFRHAIIPGLVTGFIFQAFFYFYIHVQMNISAYNAIYGSFAVIPLLLLFLNIFWCIILFGVELTYYSQNLELYRFNDDVENVSNRFYDFTALLVTSLICKRYEEGGTPYTVAELATLADIPTRLTQQVIDELERDVIVYEVGDTDNKSQTPRYVPAIDINKFTVGKLFEILDQHGREDFKADYPTRFSNQWQTLMTCKEAYYSIGANTLLKDL